MTGCGPCAINTGAMLETDAAIVAAKEAVADAEKRLRQARETLHRLLDEQLEQKQLSYAARRNAARERNQTIYERYRAGETEHALAAAFGLSHERICQICAAEWRKAYQTAVNQRRAERKALTGNPDPVDIDAEDSSLVAAAGRPYRRPGRRAAADDGRRAEGEGAHGAPQGGGTGE